MIVGIEVQFDAAHYLPNYPGKCQNMHGHTWTVEVEVMGDIQDNGMVVDFSQLKTDVNILLEAFDHQVINDHIYQPTCENLTKWIFQKLIRTYPIQSVKVREGSGGWSRL